MPEPITGGGKPHYVVGFMVDDRDRVVLIRKNRPAWQAGQLNGVGGKIEPGESPWAAMCREFHEEAGQSWRAWDCFLTYHYDGGHIWFFRMFADANVVDGVRTCTDEPIEVWQIGDLLQPGTPITPNLRWLVPLAAHRHDQYEAMAVTEVPR